MSDKKECREVMLRKRMAKHCDAIFDARAQALKAFRKPPVRTLVHILTEKAACLYRKSVAANRGTDSSLRLFAMSEGLVEALKIIGNELERKQ